MELFSIKDFPLSVNEILDDYRTACISRQLSLLGRKEVLTGKAKFGIFGDGKELPQLALAHQFKNGDWRSGYYRDQTWMLATGMTNPQTFFAQLYGDSDINWHPDSVGRSFNNHWATRLVDDQGNWFDQTKQKNTASDLSPTASQMPRLIGLALASKLYRQFPQQFKNDGFSISGNEVAFGSIGDASTSEGYFFETINAAGVLQIPVAISVWDDGYGISVAKKYQTTKESISEILEGFKPTTDKPGVKIYRAKGWDYPELVKIYAEGIAECRAKHQPVVFHIEDLTQPQGHSTSGSHERYKTKERLDWEAEYDGMFQMKKWMLESEVATSAQLEKIEKEAINQVKTAKEKAWKNFTKPILYDREKLIQMVENRKCSCLETNNQYILQLISDLKKIDFPIRKDVVSTGRKILRYVCSSCPAKDNLKTQLKDWLKQQMDENADRYSTHIYNETPRSVKNIKPVEAEFEQNPAMVNGREIIRDNWNKLLQKHPNLIIFGEDVGKIGGVNQTYEGLQLALGEHRVTDTGIREATIMGQGIGLALRGFRPVAEIQYFDYLLYGLQVLSDDLASLLWRTKGGQTAPLIITTRGHRLEGIWHSGSPMGMVINALRGIHICVPRNMTQAAGMYNTLLQAEEPALVIEPLNGYRLKEALPRNLGEFNVPLGKPEILISGDDVTLVTYGSCVRIALDAVEQLQKFGIRVELIDVQTLLPFDVDQVIVQSLKKTSRIAFFDEDVPGGATAYMMKKILEDQGGYQYLDSKPVTITAKDHRPAFATDGDYFSNPNAEDVFEAIYGMMHEVNPGKFSEI